MVIKERRWSLSDWRNNIGNEDSHMGLPMDYRDNNHKINGEINMLDMLNEAYDLEAEIVFLDEGDDAVEM
ncbi:MULTISPECIES: hypothetical protein [unclassified Moraxella]|uniref:hypothetical protein n=1 Tax=unclassified Moraxella TaxID=2685852 RepID=UPI003AF914DA